MTSSKTLHFNFAFFFKLDVLRFNKKCLSSVIQYVHISAIKKSLPFVGHRITPVMTLRSCYSIPQHFFRRDLKKGRYNHLAKSWYPVTDSFLFTWWIKNLSSKKWNYYYNGVPNQQLSYSFFIAFVSIIVVVFLWCGINWTAHLYSLSSDTMWNLRLLRD